MNIGLLSMHRVANYGSFWQAYCLKNMIQKCTECELYFIDIIPGDVDSRTEYKRKFSISKIKRIPYYIFQRYKKDMFSSYQKTVLGCTEKPNHRTDYDAIIIGSDEVFNFVQQSPWGFTTQLYGDIPNENVNSYAACFGNTTYDAIIQNHREDRIANGLKNLRNISVRDQNSLAIVEKIIGRTPDIHLDPVIVGDLPVNLPEIKNKRYLLVYSYDFRLADDDVISQVRKFAKNRKLQIISVGFYQDWVDKNILPTPMELLTYFKNAEYVVTDTFHGTIFSMRMHRKFITVIRETNKQKIDDLLTRIGMEDRKYSIGNSLEDVLLKDIDYKRFETLRNNERKRTDSYLEKCLKI